MPACADGAHARRLSQLCHRTRETGVFVNHHDDRCLIPRGCFAGIRALKVRHEMDERTRSPDRADNGLRTVGEGQAARRRGGGACPADRRNASRDR
ncbi:hypothetical protein chiPu_0029443, partial [Chiloscyllium punctatum]|nr:hypothetical protein [Chiloscyllium punctatum]